MTILSKDEDGRPGIKVVSTKIPVDQHDSFNLLVEYLSKTGVIETCTPSALLRNSIIQLLNTYSNEIENYRTLKRQGFTSNTSYVLGNIENGKILGNEHLHLSVNDDGRSYQQGMNKAPVKEREDLQEKVHDYDKPLISYKNQQPSHIQSTREEFKEPQEMRFHGNDVQYRTEDPTANLYKLDMFKYMYTLVMIDRHSKDKTVYLEVNEATKEVMHLVPSYGLDAWKKRQQKI
jgi:hypothetical protein